MAKAQITLIDGTKLTILGTPDEIAAVMAKVGPKPAGRVTAPDKSKTNAKPELTDHIENLIDAQFFKKPKDLAAVKLALAEMGHHYPVTSISPTLLRQVRKKNLRRLKESKRWVYTG